MSVEVEFLIENRHNPYQDSSLSIEAKGALAYLLSIQGRISINDFRKDNNVGRDKTREIFNELEDNGYLTRERKNNQVTGTFYWIMYVTYNPRTENQGMVPPEVEEPLTENQGMVDHPSPSSSPGPLSSPSSQDSLFPERDFEEPFPPIVPPSLRNVDIPLELADERFFKVWEEWVQYRKQSRHSLKPVTIPKQIKQLMNWTKDALIPAAVAAEILNHAMTKGWTGYHELDYRHPVWENGWNWNTDDKGEVMSDLEYMKQFE